MTCQACESAPGSRQGFQVIEMRVAARHLPFIYLAWTLFDRAMKEE